MDVLVKQEMKAIRIERNYLFVSYFHFHLRTLNRAQDDQRTSD